MQRNHKIIISTVEKMKKIIPITVFLLTLIFFIPTSSQAIFIENLSTVFQTNDCFECGNVEQVNRSFITQNIILGSSWFISDNRALLFNALNNIASTDQTNFCVDCNEVEQNNSATVIQNISLPIPQLPPSFISNLAEVEQGNICEECRFDDQINSSSITQQITLPDTSTLNPGNSPASSPLSILANFSTISQLNFCIMCDGVSQSNLALVVQNIRSQDIRSMPEPGTVLLLGSGLVGLGLLHFAKRRLYRYPRFSGRGA